jgi:WhiB family transcriptional regulator, redox-sensing transcriptional regulator
MTTTISTREQRTDLPVGAVGLGAATPIIGKASRGRGGAGGAHGRPARSGRRDQGRPPRPPPPPTPPPAAAVTVVTQGVDPNWRENAACREINPELFHPDFLTGAAVANAKRVCQRCPVRDPCLRVGLANNDRQAILGNTSPSERKPLHYAAARNSFELAGRIGKTAAARQLKVGLHVLYRAWDLWGLGRPATAAQAVAS